MMGHEPGNAAKKLPLCFVSLSLHVCLFLAAPSLVTIVTGEQMEKQKVYRYRFFMPSLLLGNT